MFDFHVLSSTGSAGFESTHTGFVPKQFLVRAGDRLPNPSAGDRFPNPRSLTKEVCYVNPNTGDQLRNERDHRGKAGQEQTFCVRKAIPVPAVPAPQQLRGHPQ